MNHIFTILVGVNRTLSEESAIYQSDYIDQSGTTSLSACYSGILKHIDWRNKNTLDIIKSTDSILSVDIHPTLSNYVVFATGNLTCMIVSLWFDINIQDLRKYEENINIFIYHMAKNYSTYQEFVGKLNSGLW